METNQLAVCQELRAIKGKVWCDDHADVWLGDCKSLGKDSLTTQNYDNVKNFSSDATCSQFLYFVCWSNDAGQNGFLAEIVGQNGVSIYSGDKNNWKVYPTGIDFDDNSPRPSKELIEEHIQIAHCKGWKDVFVGPQNLPSSPLGPPPSIPFGYKANISKNSKFIWCNSGNDSRSLFPASPYVPFAGFNHNEFVIFRLPVRDLFRKECINCPEVKCMCGDDCGCGCKGCNQEAEVQNEELIGRAQSKFHADSSSSNPACLPPFSRECEKRVIQGQFNFEPCFHFHWGDSATDQFEEHDTEVFYLTVCNNFKDIQYRGLRITKLILVPNIHALDKIQIVPDRFVCLDCLDPCTCQTREFILMTRANDIAGSYRLVVEYCYEEIVLASSGASAKVVFPIEITED